MHRMGANVARTLPIVIPEGALATFCQRHQIQRLSFFGSILRDDFSPASDVDVLVDFQEGHAPGLLGLSAMQRELSALLGRRVDLNTRGFLSPSFASQVLQEAQDHYVAA